MTLNLESVRFKQILKFLRVKEVNPIRCGLFAGTVRCGGGGVRANPPLVSQLWDPKNSKTQFSQTNMVLSFHLSS